MRITCKIFSNIVTVAALAAAALIPAPAAAGRPVGLEIKSGIGIGQYAMEDLNYNIALHRLETRANYHELTSGFNFMAEGRVWLFGRVAALAGFEHYWAAVDLPRVEARTINFTAPVDVYYLGGALNVVSFADFIDINAGSRGTFARAVYGTNETTLRLAEYKANAYGWDIFTEANTNFLRPLQIGLTVGYRRLIVDGFQGRRDERPRFDKSRVPVTLDYSGVFFYLTAGIAIR